MAKKDKMTDMPQLQGDNALFETLGKNKKRKKRKIIITVVSIAAILAIMAVVGVSSLQRRVRERFASQQGDVLSYDVTAEQMKDWANMMQIEFVHITKDTTVDALEKELFLNDLAWKLR